MIKAIRGIFISAGEFCWMIAGLLGLMAGTLVAKILPGSGMGAALGQWGLGILLLLPITGPLILLALLFDLIGGAKRTRFGK